MSNRPTGFPLGKPIRIAEKHSGPSVYDTPFDSVAEACATIAEGVRGLGLTVKVLIAGKVVEYWWESGTTNAHLVQKATGTGGGNGGSTIQTIEVNELSDIDNLNLSENLYIIKGGVKGQLIVVDDEAIVYTAELSGFICEKAVITYSGKLDGFVCAYKPMIDNLITAHLDEAGNIYAAAQHPVDSVVNVQLTFTIEGASADTRDVIIYPGNTESLRYSTGPLMEYYVSQVSSVSDSSYNYIFTSSF